MCYLKRRNIIPRHASHHTKNLGKFFFFFPNLCCLLIWFMEAQTFKFRFTYSWLVRSWMCVNKCNRHTFTHPALIFMWAGQVSRGYTLELIFQNSLFPQFTRSCSHSFSIVLWLRLCVINDNELWFLGTATG